MIDDMWNLIDFVKILAVVQIGIWSVEIIYTKPLHYTQSWSSLFNIPLMSCYPSAALSFTSSYFNLSLHEL